MQDYNNSYDAIIEETTRSHFTYTPPEQIKIRTKEMFKEIIRSYAKIRNDNIEDAIVSTFAMCIKFNNKLVKSEQIYSIAKQLYDKLESLGRRSFSEMIEDEALRKQLSNATPDINFSI